MSEQTVDQPDRTAPPDPPAPLCARGAYLLKSRVNPFPVPGDLELSATNLRFTLAPTAGETFVGWLEDELSAPDLKHRLRSGERVVAFELDLSTLRVSWPKQFMGAGMKLESPAGRDWLVSLIYPSGQYYTLYKTLTGRAKFKQWKSALAEHSG